MKEKTKKEKQGHARLFELAGARKNKLTLACLLSVLSSAARIVPFFTIYGVVVELLAHYTAPAEADQGKILALCAITFGAALVYGVCAYASSAISHTAAYEIIYELRLQLMEKLSRISSGYFTGTTQGAMGNTAATMAEVEQAAKNAGIHEVIQALPKGYQTVVGRDNAYLSGGEKQRLAIARVFLKDAPIVILDEATAYADAENEAKIQAAFAKLARNKTVLMIAHRLKTVERADQLLVMERGRLVGAGTHEKLLDSCATYQKLVEANQRRDRWSIGKGVVRA